MFKKRFPHFLSLLMVAAIFMVAAVPGAAQAAEHTYLTLDFTGLENLGDGWVYEGWLIENGLPVSSGRFTVDASGNLSDSVFRVEVDQEDVTTFILTIEPDPDPSPDPSEVHYLAGDFDTDSNADLTVGHPSALGNDFTDADGSFILAAPTGASVGATYHNGIWWLDPAGGSSLDLPTLPAGWVYEGWVVSLAGPISTGQFTNLEAADSDGPGPDAGPDPAPAFPGQDFVDPAKDLTDGYAAVISIEPDPDNSPGPFTLKPLNDSVIEDDGGNTLQAMANNVDATFPTGTAVLRQQETMFISALSGDNEVPPVATDAVGRIRILNEYQWGVIKFRLFLKHINEATAGHIHCAAAGVNGPVGVTLFSGESFSGTGDLAGEFAAPDAGNGCGWETLDDVINALESGDAYVNIHTTMYPGGELRGQIHILP